MGPLDWRRRNASNHDGLFEAWVLRRAFDRHANRRIAPARSLGITRECLYK